jgi:dTDP-4-amino-4,6-dideoxygalactose transaminase
MIKFLDLQKINLAHAAEIEESLLATFRSGWYLLGNEVKAFESQLQQYIGYCRGKWPGCITPDIQSLH